MCFILEATINVRPWRKPLIVTGSSIHKFTIPPSRTLITTAPIYSAKSQTPNVHLKIHKHAGPVCINLGATINVQLAKTIDCNRKLNSQPCEFEQMTIIVDNIIINIAIYHRGNNICHHCPQNHPYLHPCMTSS